MILLCGIPSESSLAIVAQALDRARIHYLMVSQRDVRELRLEVRADDAGLVGSLTGPGYAVDLDDVTGVYLRFMDDRELPELAGEPPESAVRASSRAFHDLFGQWADVAPARVINRYASMGSNFSKPYQSQLIQAYGFDVPDTLVTNDPELVRAFHSEHGRLIYKSISGERSIVGLLDAADRERLERIRWCPVQFQAFVDGPNVRVHTVGEEVFATIVETDAVDYRYAVRQTGRGAEFAPYELTREIADRCLGLSGGLGLEVAGLDLKLPSDGRVVCLEVNPSPVFSYYELNAGQPIADAVARLLASGGAQAADDPQLDDRMRRSG
jgi:ribosomal protein S6-L-glutamate ligase RimK-like protein